MNDFKELLGFLEELTNKLISAQGEETTNITVSETDNGICIKIFDDSEIKDIVNTYKENIKDLDDDLFIEAMEDMKEVLDIKEFDRLLSLDSYTEEEAVSVEEMIDCSSDIISNKIEDRINYLLKMYNKF